MASPTRDDLGLGTWRREHRGFVLIGREESFAAARRATVTELIFKLSA